MPIVRDEKDKKRFARLLYYVNDTYQDPNWERATQEMGAFDRPEIWPERVPLVKVLAWSLMPNHFHLLLRESTEKGISKFMQRLCGSMSTHFNAKYHEQGSIFQGSYKGKTANSRGDQYLRLLAVYVMIKNPFRVVCRGLTKAIHKFDDAYDWATKHSYSSLGNYAELLDSPVMTKTSSAKYSKLRLSLRALPKKVCWQTRSTTNY